MLKPDSDSDSDLDSEQVTQSDIVEAFQFLNAQGVVLDSEADTSLYITVANAMRCD